MSNSLSLEIISSDDMEILGKRIGALLEAGDRVMLHGPLGAGKTTLVRGIGEALEAEGTIQSPTFVLARTHRTRRGINLVHVDAYRLGSAIELDDLDLDFENQIVVAEWPRDYLESGSSQTLEVRIEPDTESEKRTVMLHWSNPKWSRIVSANK